jgi:hypothetical protein
MLGSLLKGVLSGAGNPPPADKPLAETQAFWRFFDGEAAAKLGVREKTLRQIFQHLDALPGALTIVETGCARKADNWAGDGQSTILFDRYVTARDGESMCYTVDIDPVAVAYCRQQVSARVEVAQGDSVAHLSALARAFAGKRAIHLLYLDSFDLDWVYWQPSAIHHLKELLALSRCIDEKTLVVVDDCPQVFHLLPDEDGGASVIGPHQVGGKGRLIAEYAETVGAKLVFAHYQAAWTGF